jgi:hypothetical protein
VLYHAAGTLPAADQVDLSGSPRVVDSFQKAGLDLTTPPGLARDLAAGKTATASFTTTSPASQATSPANAVDGFTISGLPVTQGSYVGTNPIWGDVGSPNAQDWLQVDLGTPTRLSDVKLYFYDNKQFGRAGNTYRAPASYTVQYLDGSNWVDVPNQLQSPTTPAPNLNEVTFSPVVARQLRVLMTRAPGYAVGLKEVQAFSKIAQACTSTVTGTHGGPLTATGVTCMADATVSGPVTVRPGATLVAGNATINGPVSSSGAAQLLIGDSSITGPVSISGTTGAVTIDDGSSVTGPVSINGTLGGVAVSGTRVDGPLTLTGNLGSTPIVVSANNANGPLACTSNAPPPTDLTMPNNVHGPASGQCAGLR